MAASFAVMNLAFIYIYPSVQSLKKIRFSLDFQEKVWHGLVLEERRVLSMKILGVCRFNVTNQVLKAM